MEEAPDFEIDLNRSISVTNNADRNLGVTVTATTELDWSDYVTVSDSEVNWTTCTTYNKEYALRVLEEGLRTHTIDFRDIILLCNKIKS